MLVSGFLVKLDFCVGYVGDETNYFFNFGTKKVRAKKKKLKSRVNHGNVEAHN